MQTWTEQEFIELSQRLDNSGRWGADDNLGTLNFITPAKRVAALQAVRSGEVIACADPWQMQLGAGPLTIPQIEPVLELQHANGHNGLVGTQDRLELFLHGKGSPTCLKALNHVYYQETTYNHVGPDDRDAAGIRRQGTYPGPADIVTRGILIDIPAVRGIDFVPPDEPGTLADIEAALEQAELSVEPGDALWIRTGMPLSGIIPGPGSAVPGMSLDCAEWVHDQGIALLVTDGGMDVHPSPVQDTFIPWHLLACTRIGVRFVAHANLEQLGHYCAAQRRYDFASIIAVLPIPHAAGSPVNPLAIF